MSNGIKKEMTLKEQLRELADGSSKRHPGVAQDTMKLAIEQLENTDILAKAYKTGDALPKIQLPNANGVLVDLNAVLNEHKIVLVFYRGAWCPYCNLELRAFQKMLSKIEAKGARLVAISPQTPDNSLTTKEKNELTFEVLSDVNGDIARQMNLLYQLPESLIALYKTFGIDLKNSNGNSQNTLPIAATYIIEKGGDISYHFLKEDYKLRADPETILELL